MKKEPELKTQPQKYDRKEVFEAARIARDDFIRYTYLCRLRTDAQHATAASISSYLREICPEFAVSTTYVNTVIRSRPVVTAVATDELLQRCETYYIRLMAAISELKAALQLED